ncbi:unnamed protein product [Ambrosiozyma monospora]|uniref:Unnamed protein product n=1 Tax=Ambrosiozyma monospora TaxID=43982 RepID=A0ACB5T025_AMBMO|nr:unnamed protein product [Ambrosiozyma monospora]
MAPIALADINSSSSSLNNQPQSDYQLPLGEYIFKRIESLGIKSIFGVPGDFNLQFLEHLYQTNVKWYGCCNELNASYATDGYSRATGKLGVLVTTFGVGEMSAMNGVSGAFAESVPMLHIVGTTALAVKSSGANIHHLVPNISTGLQKSDHYAYEKMVGPISCRVESLKGLQNATDLIDGLIRTILEKKRPGYLYLPCDLVDQFVDASNLINVPGETFFVRNSTIPPSVQRNITELILQKVYHAKKPVILADVLVDRYGLTSQLREFVKMTNIPNSSTAMGKSILDESQASYIGDYIGDESAPQVAEYVRSADLVLHFGDYYNEINSGHNSLYKDLL